MYNMYNIIHTFLTARGNFFARLFTFKFPSAAGVYSLLLSAAFLTASRGYCVINVNQLCNTLQLRGERPPLMRKAGAASATGSAPRG
jgi:hypothetical protein